MNGLANPSPISIHALLAESDGDAIVSGLTTAVISIHALLAESDAIATRYSPVGDISIHALLAESDRNLASFVGA